MPIAMTPKRAALKKAREESAAKKASLKRSLTTTATGLMIRHHREKLDLSQKDVAKSLGFSNVFLSRIEFGKCNLPIKYVEKVAKILKLSKDDLLFSLKHDLSNRLDKRASG